MVQPLTGSMLSYSTVSEEKVSNHFTIEAKVVCRFTHSTFTALRCYVVQPFSVQSFGDTQSERLKFLHHETSLGN
jgi:hypothetical protein